MTTTPRESPHAVDRLRETSRLLSGPPSLARGEPVVAARDPLGLATHRAGVALGELRHESRNATQDDHALPQRQAFRLPVGAPAAGVGEERG